MPPCHHSLPRLRIATTSDCRVPGTRARTYLTSTYLPERRVHGCVPLVLLSSTHARAPAHAFPMLESHHIRYFFILSSIISSTPCARSGHKNRVSVPFSGGPRWVIFRIPVVKRAMAKKAKKSPFRLIRFCLPCILSNDCEAGASCTFLILSAEYNAVAIPRVPKVYVLYPGSRQP